MEIIRDAVAAVDVSRHPRDVERLAGIVALHERDRRRRRRAALERPAERKGSLEAERDLGLHIGEFLLDELVGGERPAELLPVERILARPLPAIFSRAHRAPSDAVARLVEAAE